MNISKRRNEHRDSIMANAIYVVSKETNLVLRKAKTFAAAVKFCADNGLYNALQGKEDFPVFLCESEFAFKKGDNMSNTTCIIEL